MLFSATSPSSKVTLALQEQQQKKPLLHVRSVYSDGSDHVTNDSAGGVDEAGEEGGHVLRNEPPFSHAASSRVNVRRGMIDYHATQATRASYPSYRARDRGYNSYRCYDTHRGADAEVTVGQDTTTYPYNTPSQRKDRDRYHADEEPDGYDGLIRSRSAPALSFGHMRRVSVFEGLYDNFVVAQGGSLLSSGFNLASATLGAGVLALPSAFEGTGVLLGSILLCCVYLTNMYSVTLLIQAGEAVELYSYEELAYELGGPFCQAMTVFCTVVFCWGVSVSYIVSMGDFMEHLVTPLGLSSYLDRQSAMLIFWSFIMLPLSLVRNVNTLRYASGLGVMSSLLLSFALVMKFLESGDIHHVRLGRVDDRFVNSVSTFIFSYCFQPVLFQVYIKMHRCTLQRVTLCSTCTMGLCTLLYVTTGVFGALTYGEQTQPNILTNLSTQLYLFYVVLAYIGVIVSVTMAFPMTILPTRDSILIALGYSQRDNSIDPTGTRTDQRMNNHSDGKGQPPTHLSILIGAILASLALLIGFYVPNIQYIFSLLGSICGGSLSFMLPGWFVMRLAHRVPELFSRADLLGARAMFALGLFVCVLGTYNSIVTTFLAHASEDIIVSDTSLD